MLLITGCAAAVRRVFFIVVAREHPPTPAGWEDERSLMFDGLKSMLKQRDFILLLVIFFIGLGMFNGITTWIEEIVGPRGFTPAQAGIAGGLMLIGGDRGRRGPPDRLGLHAQAQAVHHPGPGGADPRAGGADIRRRLLAAAGGIVVRLRVVPAQRGAYRLPVRRGDHASCPEGTSNSLLLVMGQVSGIVFIFGMDAFKSPCGSMTESLVALLALTLAAVCCRCS